MFAHAIASYSENGTSGYVIGVRSDFASQKTGRYIDLTSPKEDRLFSIYSLNTGDNGVVNRDLDSVIAMADQIHGEAGEQILEFKTPIWPFKAPKAFEYEAIYVKHRENGTDLYAIKRKEGETDAKASRITRIDSNNPLEVSSLWTRKGFDDEEYNIETIQGVNDNEYNRVDHDRVLSFEEACRCVYKSISPATIIVGDPTETGINFFVANKDGINPIMNDVLKGWWEGRKPAGITSSALHHFLQLQEHSVPH